MKLISGTGNRHRSRLAALVAVLAVLISLGLAPSGSPASASTLGPSGSAADAA